MAPPVVISSRPQKTTVKSRTRQAREPDLTRYYRHKLPALDPGEIEFRVLRLRKGTPRMIVNRVVEGVEWSDDSGTSSLSGSLSVRRPRVDDPGSLPIGRGDRIQLRIKWAGAWHIAWTMRAGALEVNLTDGSLTIPLTDDLDAMRRTQKDWLFRKDKSHPKGWYAHEVARVVCRRAGVRIGQLARGTVLIARIKKDDADPIQPILAAYQRETKSTGRRFLFRMRDGRFDVVPFHRNNVVYTVGPQAIDVQARRLGSPRPFTVITGHAKVGKGSEQKKIEHTEFNRDVVNRYGYNHREIRYGKVESADQLRQWVKRDLAEAIKVRRSLSVENPLLPFTRRGDAVKVHLPAEGYRQEDGFMFVQSISHQLSQADHRSNLELVELDPYKRYQEQLEEKQRAEKRRERKKEAA